MLQKRSKNSLKCFRGQILTGTKTTGNQCWNAQETHYPHYLSISKDNICAVKTKNPPQHTPPVFLRYPVTLFHGQIIPSQIILLLDFFVSSSTIIVRTFPESLSHKQKQGHYSSVYLVLLPIHPRRFCRKTCFEASRAVFWSLSCYKELKLTYVPPSRYIQFTAF